MLTWNIRKTTTRATTAALFVTGTCLLSAPSSARNDDDDHLGGNDYGDAVQVGPRPYYLINKMSPSPLKRQLESCVNCAASG
jgi:glycerophosphoryl diester phosphodiesterase